jgi:hypothetical protein
MPDPKPEWKTHLVKGKHPDRTFDNEFWQAQGDEAIFSAAWEMVRARRKMKYGRRPTLQRTVTALQRLPR